MALENIKLLYKLREAVIELLNDYSFIVSNAKYKKIHRKEILSMLAQVAEVAKVSDHSNLKILSLKQMLQKLPVALAQVKKVNTSENSLNEIRQIIHSLYRAKKVELKKYITISRI